MPGFEQDRLLLALASGVLAQTFLVRLLPPWLVKPLKRPWPALKELRVGTNHARNGLHTHPSQLLLSLPQNTAPRSSACQKPPPSPPKRCQWGQRPAHRPSPPV